MASENGFATNIGNRRCKLLGGQRQRISIVRAVLKNPPILILDEATSALDTESEQWVQNALEKLIKNYTILIVVHQISTIKDADLICVVYEGRIVEIGTMMNWFVWMVAITGYAVCSLFKTCSRNVCKNTKNALASCL